MKYNLAFTAGALLFGEAILYINSIHDFTDYCEGNEIVNMMSISTNSESSKKRLKSELDKRLKNLNSEYLEVFSNSSITDQKVILFLAVCKTYTIIRDFMLEVVYEKWKNFNNDLQTYDFQYFLSMKLSSTEIDKISEKSRYKLSQVAILMLKNVGLFINGKILSVTPSLNLLQILEKNNDEWFLNCLLINNNSN